MLLVSLNEYTNRKCSTQGGSKDVDESLSGIIYESLKVNKVKINLQIVTSKQY
jgi:hypothetical protein